MTEPLVYICILNWNGLRDTTDCLESVYRNSYPNYRTVVVDNASTDHSVEEIKRWANRYPGENNHRAETTGDSNSIYVVSYCRKTAEQGGEPLLERKIESCSPNKSLVIINSEGNLGFSGGNNIGIRYACQKNADYVWLLNNDTVIDREALKEMVELAEKYKNVGMVGSKLLFFDEPDKIQVLGGAISVPLHLLGFNKGAADYDRGQWNSVLEIDFIFGASLLVKRKAIAKTGLLNEDYFLLFEDTEWCLRARRSGWRLLFCPKSTIYHKVSQSIKWTSPFADYYYTRNLLFFVKRFYPFLLPAIIARLLMRTARRVAKYETANVQYIFNAVWDFLHNRKGKRI